MPRNINTYLIFQQNKNSNINININIILIKSNKKKQFYIVSEYIGIIIIAKYYKKFI